MSKVLFDPLPFPGYYLLYPFDSRVFFVFLYKFNPFLLKSFLEGYWLLVAFRQNFTTPTQGAPFCILFFLTFPSLFAIE